MKTLVVYDSYFGNTEKVARAVAGALEPQGEGGMVRAAAFQPEQLQGVQLLVVGSPTRAFQPSDATRAFLKTLKPQQLNGLKVAAFDTRISAEESNSSFLRFMIKLFGYAAKPISNQLVKKGGHQAAEPEGFYVKASEGPLKDGEIERATQWAKQLLTG